MPDTWWDNEQQERQAEIYRKKKKNIESRYSGRTLIANLPKVATYSGTLIGQGCIIYAAHSSVSRPQHSESAEST